MIARFASLAEYLAQAATANVTNVTSDHSWDLGVGGQTALNLAKHGDPSLVASTIEALDTLAPTVSEDMKSRWIPTVAGSRCDVSSYLAGSPMSMRRRKRSDGAVRHLSIYVEISAMARVKAADILKRGQAILAFLEYLQASQINVSLNLTLDTDGKSNGDLFQIIPIESQPLDLSVAAFAMCHPAFARNVGFRMAKKLDGGGTMPSRNLANLGREAYIPFIRETLGMESYDVYVPEIFPGDNPDTWLAERVRSLQA